MVPQIRFAGFTDPWEQRKLGDELEFLRNNTLSRAELSESEGTAFDIHYGDVLIKYGSVLNLEKAEVPRIVDSAIADRQTCDRLQDGDVIIADTAEDSAVGKCTELCNSKGKMVFSGLHTMPLRPMGEYASGYLGHYLNSSAFHSQLLPLMQGIKVISISRSAMADTTMTVPSVDEQRQIGAFFDRLDSLITLHQRKYDKLCVLKKSMLDKMFPKGGSMYPEIRFAGFTDPWEQRKLGEVARRVTRKNENGDSDLPLTISAQYGLVDQRTFFNSQVASKDMSGYYLLPRGEFAYNKSTSADSPWGAIKRLEKYDMGCVSTLYICFELLSGDPDFLVTYYETDRWYKAVQLIAAEGARNHGLLNIAPDDFFETQICIPKRIDEQCRIGAFFDRLDSLITLHQRKLELLRNIKKSMLDKMFV